MDSVDTLSKDFPKVSYQPYLAGGGEMGKLTRSFDWSKTALGPPENWPSGLLTTLSIVLNSKFPMLLWWGPELVQFYNDAFRLSLGNNGKHPKALGQRGEACWPEIWPVIKPLIDQVIATGEAAWNEDQLIPIYRNNKLEDAYWTFSYSKVIDESGQTAGVLVICNETTEQVNARKKITESYEKQAQLTEKLLASNQEKVIANEVLEAKNTLLAQIKEDLHQKIGDLAASESHFRNLLLHAPIAIAIFREPNFIIELANEKMLEYWGRTLEQVINQPAFTALPEASGLGFEELLTNVLQTGEPFIANEMPVALFRNGKMEATWVNFIYTAIKKANGEITAIMAVCTEVTEQVNARKAIEQAEEKLRLAVDSAEMGTWHIIVEGRQFVPSQRLKEIYGYYPDEEMSYKTGIGLIIEEHRERVKAAIENAILTGEDYHEEYVINGYHDRKPRWVKATGKLYPTTQNIPAHFSGTVMDITELKAIDQQKDESIKGGRDLLQSVFDTSLIGMAVLKAVRDEGGEIQDFSIKLVNKELEKLTGRKNLTGKLYSKEYPGIKQSGLYELMLKVMESGIPEQREYHYFYDGFDKWFSSMFVKMEDGLVATNLDITERKLAELEKLKNLTIMEQAEQVAKLGSWEYDLQTEKFSWSGGMYSLFGLKKGTLVVPEIYLQHAAPENRPVATRIVNAIKSGAGDFKKTIEILAGNNRKTIKVNATVIRNITGQAERIIGVNVDLTEQMKLLKEKKQIEASQNQKIFQTTLDVQEQERERIAESLHNTLGQLLFGIKISMSHFDITRQTADREELVQAKQYTENLLAEAIRECRRISHELSPIILEDFGLKEAVEDLCRQLNDFLPVICVFKGLNSKLGKYLEITIYRTIQELMMNITKHAKATKAGVEIEIGEKAVHITVKDNGIGFDQNNTSDGIGLKMIRNKLRLLNGMFDLVSGPENIIHISIPYGED